MGIAADDEHVRAVVVEQQAVESRAARGRLQPDGKPALALGRLAGRA